MMLKAPRFILCFLMITVGFSFSFAKSTLKWPKAEGVRPVLVIVHDRYGVNNFINSVAEKYLEKNYAVLLVDLYGGKSFDEEREADLEAEKLNREIAVKKIKSSVEKLKNQAKIDKEKIGILAYGLGATVALRALPEMPEIKTAVLIEGTPVLEIPRLDKIKTKLLIATGKNDPRFPDSLMDKFKKTLTEAHVTFDVIRIEKASSGFYNHTQIKTYLPPANLDLQKSIDTFHEKHLALTKY